MRCMRCMQPASCGASGPARTVRVGLGLLPSWMLHARVLKHANSAESTRRFALRGERRSGPSDQRSCATPAAAEAARAAQGRPQGPIERTCALSERWLLLAALALRSTTVSRSAPTQHHQCERLISRGAWRAARVGWWAGAAGGVRAGRVPQVQCSSRLTLAAPGKLQLLLHHSRLLLLAQEPPNRARGVEAAPTLHVQLGEQNQRVQGGLMAAANGRARLGARAAARRRDQCCPTRRSWEIGHFFFGIPGFWVPNGPKCMPDPSTPVPAATGHPGAPISTTPDHPTLGRGDSRTQIRRSRGPGQVLHQVGRRGQGGPF